MQTYEYKVVPAPVRGEKERGARTGAERFGVALTNLMNAMARDGWEYQRSDTLPCEERVGFTGKTTAFQNMLVFRRRLLSDLDEPAMMTFVAGQNDDEQQGPRVGSPMGESGNAPPVGPVRPELAAE